MISIGLTGNVGSGKSTVAAIWEKERGALLIDADSIGRSVVRPGSRCLAALTERFGEGILLPDSSLDRRKMAGIAFSDKKNREALNSIVHPELIREINDKLRDARSRDAKAVVVDAALIFEFGLNHCVDVVVAVDAPRETKIERMLAKGKMDRETLERMLEVQISPQELKARAGHVLDNSADQESLKKSALELFDRLVREENKEAQ